MAELILLSHRASKIMQFVNYSSPFLNMGKEPQREFDLKIIITSDTFRSKGLEQTETEMCHFCQPKTTWNTYFSTVTSQIKYLFKKVSHFNNACMCGGPSPSMWHVYAVSKPLKILPVKVILP